jgi:DNA mismatch repair protein MutL
MGMNRIAVLPLEISQKIAAGEVIERPVSVVKELVENSLDAGSSEIRVDLLAGGKKLIRVQDDGHGMGRADAELSFIRHSTSKIAGEDDLLEIATLGFRGEALPSISAVSRITLRTSEGGDAAAVEIEREGDAVRAVREIALPRGTTLEVRDLFFNLPARLKFLRSDSSELTQIAKYMTNVALAYPGLRLSLSHGPRSVLDCPPVAGLRERIFQLYGNEILDRLMEIDHGESGGRLFGFASRPPHGRADRSHQLFFVNNRPVRDKILASALNQAYRGLLEKEMSPEAFLFLTVPYGEVDVNVHPAKSEVRFRDSSSVFRLVLRSVERARYGIGGLKEIEAGGHGREGPGASGGAGTLAGWGAPSDFSPVEFSPAAQFGLGVPFKIGERPWSFGRQAAFGRPAGASDSEPDGHPGAETAGEGHELRVLGQFADAYIVVESGDGLLVVDQHNAHERILFDKYAEIRARKTWPVALSLVPLLFDLSPSQVVRLEAEQAGLEESGFRVEPMGGRSYALREYPDIFKPQEALAVVTSLLEEDPDGPGERKKERLLATMACKSAIKAGQPLPREKMEFLVQELFRTSQPSLCPHGRPIVVKIPRGQIEKGLGRPAR